MDWLTRFYGMYNLVIAYIALNIVLSRYIQFLTNANDITGQIIAPAEVFNRRIVSFGDSG